MKKRSKKEEKQLQEEIQKYANEPRSIRRKKERELKKEYQDKDITIKSGKKFKKTKEPLTRKQRRILLKDQNLLREILKIIRKYFPQLENLFSKLTDKRHKSYITYKMRTIIMIRLLSLICGITTMKGINQKFNTDEAIQNLSSICNQELKEVPDWQTIQDVIETLSIEEIEDIRKYMVKALIRSKMFDRFRYKGAIQVLVDATGLSSHDYNLNGNCISKTKNGVTKYYKYVLEAKIVFGNIVISIDSEWIENKELNNENDKQDCEINAFKRMAPRLKKNFPKLKFIITGDALYATTPIINICKENKWYYIFNLKKDRLKNVYEQFTDNINYYNETKKENYYLSKNIEFNGNVFDVFKYIETTNNKTTTFHYISNLNIKDNNIEEIVNMGRRRWKIENEGFNQQKNGTFCISHVSSRHIVGLKIQYYLIQIAHIIRQLLEYGSILLKEMRGISKKEASSQIFTTLTSNTISNFNCLDLNFQLRFDD